MTNRLGLGLTIFLALFAAAAMAHADEFTLMTYTFTADVTKAGRVSLRVEKDPGGLNLLVSSAGGALATVRIPPEKAKAVGGVLMQAEEYYEKHQQYYEQRKNTSAPLYRKELSEIVKVEGYQVIFESTPRGEDFSVKVGRTKPFSPMALMTREEALGIGQALQKGEELAAFINRNITF